MSVWQRFQSVERHAGWRRVGVRRCRPASRGGPRVRR